MYPANVPPVAIYAGDDIQFPPYVIKEAGVAVDLTPYTDWSAQWRLKADSTEFIELDVDTTQLNVGRIIVSANAEDTSAMGAPGTWDVQATLAGEVRTFVYGKTTWRKDVTRV